MFSRTFWYFYSICIFCEHPHLPPENARALCQWIGCHHSPKFRLRMHNNHGQAFETRICFFPSFFEHPWAWNNQSGAKMAKNKTLFNWKLPSACNFQTSQEWPGYTIRKSFSPRHFWGKTWNPSWDVSLKIDGKQHEQRMNTSRTSTSIKEVNRMFFQLLKHTRSTLVKWCLEDRVFCGTSMICGPGMTPPGTM